MQNDQILFWGPTMSQGKKEFDFNEEIVCDHSNSVLQLLQWLVSNYWFQSSTDECLRKCVFHHDLRRRKNGWIV